MSSVRKLHLGFVTEKFGLPGLRTIACAFPSITELNLGFLRKRGIDLRSSLGVLGNSYWPCLTTVHHHHGRIFDLLICSVMSALMHRSCVGYPIRTVTLPSYLLHESQGKCIACCTHPPIEVLKYSKPRKKFSSHNYDAVA